MAKPDIWYENIFVNLPKDVMKHIIGKNGANFTKLSTKLSLKYIWYNSDTCAITLYGERDKLQSAKEYLYKVIDTTVRRYAPDLISNVYNSNPIEDVTTYLSLENVIDKDDCKHLIGSNGKNFKQITRSTNIYFMWYDDEDHTIKVNGTKYHTLKAIQKIHEKLNDIKQKNFQECEENNSYEHVNKKQKT